MQEAAAEHASLHERGIYECLAFPHKLVHLESPVDMVVKTTVVGAEAYLHARFGLLDSSPSVVCLGWLSSPL